MYPTLQINLIRNSGFALCFKTIIAVLIMAIYSILPLYAQNEVTQSNENINTPFNIDTVVSKWKQNSQATSEEVAETIRQRADQILNLGILCVENEEYTEAIEWLKKAAELYLEINEDHYFYTLDWQFHVYGLLGLTNEYNYIKNEIKQAIHEDKISNNQIKLFVLSNYGKILRDEGEIKEAVLIAEKSLNSAEEIYDAFNPEIFSFLYNLCSLYLNLGELKKSKELIDRIKALKLELKADKTDYYSAILLESDWMQSSGKIGEMIQLLEKNANEIENSSDFLEMKSGMYEALGVAYSSIGNFKKSQQYNEKTLKTNSILYGENSPHYATALINLSDIYAINGFNNESLDGIIKALDIFDKLYGKKNYKYIKCLEKLASLYTYNNPQKSKELYKECLSLWESLYGENSREYAETLIWSNLDLSLNPSLTAIANVKRGIEIFKSLGFTRYEFYPSFLHFYCIMLYMIKDFSSLYTTACELLEATRNQISYNFLIMPETQREALWHSVKQNLEWIEQYATEYSQYAVENKDYSLINEYSGLCYNTRLLKKGLLLTSARNIEEIISKLDNQDINRLIDEINIQRNKLFILQPGSDDYEKIEITANNLERELLELISNHGDFMKFTSIKWQDIQDTLMPGEVAIEFFSYSCQDDNKYGMAFIGSDGDPVTFSLFMESELNKFINEDVTTFDYKDPRVYKTIWSVLDVFSEIKNAHTIYFSADGKMNIMAVENLRDSTGRLASDKRNIVRLSSTRELLRKNSHLTKSTGDNDGQSQIILYGGLDYNSPLPTASSSGDLDSLDLDSLCASTSVLSTAQRTFNNRAQYLQGTLKEVETLSRQLSIGSNSNIIQYTGSEGTEQSVYDMSYLHPNIIHIATHGFYYYEINDSLSADPSNGNEDSISIELKAMKESGLLLSGANHKLMGEEVFDEHNDGILTAEEISTISLGDVDLVVLSACETGLGSVSGEGVFGLQRGFKLSGVNCILMSLWKVDDEATKELMINFYEGIMNGLSKVEALYQAQKKVYETPGFEDPEYWAGFILLDGLN